MGVCGRVWVRAPAGRPAYAPTVAEEFRGVRWCEWFQRLAFALFHLQAATIGGRGSPQRRTRNTTSPLHWECAQMMHVLSCPSHPVRAQVSGTQAAHCPPSPLSGQETGGKDTNQWLPHRATYYSQLLDSQSNEIMCIFNSSSPVCWITLHLIVLWYRFCASSIGNLLQNRAENRVRGGHLDGNGV